MTSSLRAYIALRSPFMSRSHSEEAFTSCCYSALEQVDRKAVNLSDIYHLLFVSMGKKIGFQNKAMHLERWFYIFDYTFETSIRHNQTIKYSKLDNTPKGRWVIGSAMLVIKSELTKPRVIKGLCSLKFVSQAYVRISGYSNPSTYNYFLCTR